MLGGIALIVWAYAIARLLQVPVEYTGPGKGARIYLVITSCIGMLIASVALWDIISSASKTASTLQGIQP